MGKTVFGAGDRGHLAKSILLEESGSPLIARLVIGFTGLMVVAFVVWAAIASVDEVAIAPGEIVPVGEVQQVQHLQGGIIREILVSDGDTVKDGQVVMRLDPMVSRSEWAQAQAGHEVSLARRERLKALIEGRQPDFSGLGASFRSLAQEQEEIFEQVLRGKETRKQILQEQIKQCQAEAAELEARQRKVEQQKALLDEEIGIRQGLVDQGLNSKVLFLSLQRNQSSLSGELQEVASGRARAAGKLMETKLRLAELEAKFKEDLLIELAAVDAELAQSEELVRRNETNLEWLSIRAPVAGIVHGLMAHTVGGIVAPGSTILEIVPLGRRLVAEVKISARDIGHVRAGQPVVAKFTTYDFGRYGGIPGTLDAISATAFVGPGGESHYRGMVSLQRDYIGPDPMGNPMLPGMTLQADIKTGNKTIMQYLLKPIYASARQALRER